MSEQDITELAKRVLAMRVINPEYNHIHANQARAIYRKYALEAAPKLAQAVLDGNEQYNALNFRYQRMVDLYNLTHNANKEQFDVIKQLTGEIAALRPDAIAWREREKAYQEQIAELKSRMQAPGEKGGEG